MWPVNLSDSCQFEGCKGLVHIFNVTFLRLHIISFIVIELADRRLRPPRLYNLHVPVS